MTSGWLFAMLRPMTESPRTQPLRNVITLGLAVAVSATGCGDDITGTNNLRTIADYVQADARFATLASSLRDVNLLSTLDQPGPFTLFAPTNEAFDLIKGQFPLETTAQVSDLLRYHIHQGQISAKELERAAALSTLAGPELHVRFGLDGLLLNDGTRIVSEEIVTENGIIHVLDAVLVRPLITTTTRYEATPDVALEDTGPMTFGITESMLTINDTGFIHDLRVFIEIEHTDVSQLFVFLESGGRFIRLVVAPRSSGNDVKMTFADSADFDIIGDVVDAPDPDAQAYPETAYRPIAPLEFQLGQPIEGPWLLTVYDFRSGETGRLVRWGLEATIGDAPPAPAIVFDRRAFGGSVNSATFGRGFTESITTRLRRVGTLTGDVDLTVEAGELASGTRRLAVDESEGTLVLPIPTDTAVGEREARVAALSGGVSRVLPYDVRVVDPDASSVDLLAHVPLPALGAEGARGSDLWGWTDPLTGAEIVLMGTAVGTAFVDITTPSSPVVLGTLPTETEASDWRDIKVYQDHAFIVSEARDHGMQVFDLTQLRGVTTPQTFTPTAHNADFGSAHNIVINEDSGFAYVVGSDFSGPCSGGVLSFDISTPVLPISLGCFAGAVPAGSVPGPAYPTEVYVHDAQCVTYAGPDIDHQGREICVTSDGQPDGTNFVGIADFTDHANVLQLSRVTYPTAGYTHQGWLTEDHQYFILNDEFDEFIGGFNTRSYVWDVRDLDAPVLVGAIDNPRDSVGHNTYVAGGIAYQSNYTSGLRMVDLADIANGGGTEMAYFDTYPDDDDTDDGIMGSPRCSSSAGKGGIKVPHPDVDTLDDGCGNATFQGSWSNYPFFASGVVVISDINRGLFIVKPQ